MADRMPLWRVSTTRQLDDGNRLDPRRPSLGDDSVPCRWWHPDIGYYCARCSSGRADLHDGWWGNPSAAGGPFADADIRRGYPWTVQERACLGLEPTVVGDPP